MKRIISNQIYLVIILLFIAFFLRLYSAAKVPLIMDEEKRIALVKNASAGLTNPTFPLVYSANDSGCSPLVYYFVKAGFFIFKGNKVGQRSLFIIPAVLGLYFIYKLIEQTLGRKAGLLTLFFFVFDQLHIGVSRYMEGDALLFFFIPASIYFFFKGLRTKENIWVYLTAITVGIGFLAREFVILLLPVFFIFLIRNKEYRFWFKCKELYFSITVMILMASPMLIWVFNNKFYNYADDNLTKFGINLNVFYLYFAEILAFIAKKTSFIVWGHPVFISETIGYGSIYSALHFVDGHLKLVVDASWEYAVEHWAVSIPIFISLFYCLKLRRKIPDIAYFSLLMFGFVFSVVSIIGFDCYYIFDNHPYANMTLFPALIMCVYMLIDMAREYKFINLFIIIFMAYIVLRSIYFINISNLVFHHPTLKFFI